jgi:hypothetical protein
MALYRFYMHEGSAFVPILLVVVATGGSRSPELILAALIV